MADLFLMSRMSDRMFLALSVAPCISCFSSSMWALYSVRELQIASWKKRGGEGRVHTLK